MVSQLLLGKAALCPYAAHRVSEMVCHSPFQFVFPCEKSRAPEAQLAILIHFADKPWEKHVTK